MTNTFCQDLRQPETPGATDPSTRAMDMAGRTRPDLAVPDTQGYLFDAVVRHPLNVV
ncbi:hypothetical protein [Streptomyces sp. NPDC059787]|uniref:hypothetical protein n=1 Tax=Streptomyces sp. NPDC059787 TaxID=3346947 RepID=UPI00365693B4